VFILPQTILLNQVKIWFCPKVTGMSYNVKAKENVSASVEIFNAIPSPPGSAPAKLRPINSRRQRKRGRKRGTQYIFTYFLRKNTTFSSIILNEDGFFCNWVKAKKIIGLYES